jgi:uncharacterized membrane protein YdbT with pleckstrin-like domain
MGMRVIPNETLPATVYRVLLPYEQQAIVPVAQTLGGLAVAGLLSTITHLTGTIVLIIWLAWLILLVRLLFRIYQYLDDYFVVTSQRLILATGVFKKSVDMMPLSKVTDMRFERSATARLFGYGTFVVESAGKDKMFSRIDHLPYPEQLYLEVCGLIFKDPGKGDD